ncbi:MAG: hypothetical protein L0332_27020 [Chloroflexi bacterium]|nr:hypothetical protein [Chloroflexota bacterium]MCI0578250.1 hypothetical protein [Chloroflexota bacterium]MCI0649633.1 hypothetical protein [Chloroflexota bacterium]MCI0730351.1 hypothetical protein [Chloroflexota bacterium]
MGKRSGEMSQAEFDDLVEGAIDRMATRYGEIPAGIFLDLLAERIATKADETINLSLEIVGDKLVITPDREVAGVVVRGNKILAGRYRLVLKPSARRLAGQMSGVT